MSDATDRDTSNPTTSNPTTSNPTTSNPTTPRCPECGEPPAGVADWRDGCSWCCNGHRWRERGAT